MRTRHVVSIDSPLQQASRIREENPNEFFNEHELIQIQKVVAALLEHLVLIIADRGQS